MVNDGNYTLNILLTVLAVIILNMLVACQTEQTAVAGALAQCKEYLDEDDVRGANLCYLDTLLTYPENIDEISEVSTRSILEKCTEFSEDRRFGDAIVCYEGLAELLPDKHFVFIHLAESYYQFNKELGDITDDTLLRAENAIKKAIELRPDRAVAHGTYGRILGRKGDLPGAIREIEKATELAPDDGLYWIELGRLNEKKNDLQRSVECYLTALKLDPDDAIALSFLGNTYHKAGEMDKALEVYDRLIKIDPKDHEAKEKIKLLREEIAREVRRKA